MHQYLEVGIVVYDRVFHCQLSSKDGLTNKFLNLAMLVSSAPGFPVCNYSFFQQDRHQHAFLAPHCSRDKI